MNFLADDKNITDFFGTTPLLSTSIRVTKKCNLRCKHCYADGGTSGRNELSKSEIFDILEQLKKMNVSDVFFTGGEPFIRKDMIDILSYSNICGFNTLVSTNGHFINEEIAKRLKDLKLKMMQVSVDGTKEIHTTNRGVSAWDDAMRALDLLVKENVENVTVGSVVLRNNNELSELLTLCKEKNIPLFALMLLIEAGRAEHMRGPEPEQMQKILDQVFSKYLEYGQTPEFSSNTTLPPALVPYAARKENIHKKFACCSFPYILGIEANGDVAPCDGFFPYKEMIVGNIRENSIEEIWENSPILKEIRSIELKDMEGVCKKCKYLEYCAGGCRAAAYNKYHDLTMPDPACQNLYDAGLFPKEALK